LEKFKTNKLALNHNFNLLKTSVTLFKKARGSGLDMIMLLVSSAKRIGEEILFNTSDRSLWDTI
jgi:hypothetical protein